MNYAEKNILISLVIFVAACGSAPKPLLSSFENSGINARVFHSENTKTFASDENFIVLITQPGDTLESLAAKYLGDSAKAWIIADFNDINEVLPKREIVIPLKPHNPTGIYPDGYQTIPILCYHRFGEGHDKMAVSAKNFREQMQYLKDNDFHVIAMKDIYDFVNGMSSLPKKSVIITIDDGYRSTFEVAYPILKDYHFPATVFLYTDFMGAGDALNWQQTNEMAASELIDFQPHSKTHPNMSLPKINESDSDYQARVRNEIDNPSQKIEKYIKIPLHTFAYPYGDTNEMIIDYLKKIKYKLGVTVQPGGNATFAHPYMLHRTMIFGDHDIKSFEKSLVTFKQVNLK